MFTVIKIINMLQTGYFARATEKGHKNKSTISHLLKDGKVLCGYKPHKTMQFLWCSTGAKMSHVECNKCKNKYQDHFEVECFQ